VNIERHSPSSLNLFAASPAMYVLERVMGKRQPVGAPAHRGTAVEAGVTLGLMDPDKPVADCVKLAQTRFDTLMALSGDPRRDEYGKTIPAMVETALEELRPYGVPSRTQGFVEWRPEGVRLPIVGYFDFAWDEHGIIVDLKTTGALPSAIKTGHARQVALYAESDNYDARLTYVTPKKRATYRLENIRAHREALLRIAQTVERFLSLSDDPKVLAGLVVPDLESFYWADPSARALAYQTWGI
jgi:hypothetical protein